MFLKNFKRKLHFNLKLQQNKKYFLNKQTLFEYLQKTILNFIKLFNNRFLFIKFFFLIQILCSIFFFINLNFILDFKQLFLIKFLYLHVSSAIFSLLLFLSVFFLFILIKIYKNIILLLLINFILLTGLFSSILNFLTGFSWALLTWGNISFEDPRIFLIIYIIGYFFLLSFVFKITKIFNTEQFLKLNNFNFKNYFYFFKLTIKKLEIKDLYYIKIKEISKSTINNLFFFTLITLFGIPFIRNILFQKQSIHQNTKELINLSDFNTNYIYNFLIVFNLIFISFFLLIIFFYFEKNIILIYKKKIKNKLLTN
jgi:hypothetical protein